MCTLLSASAGSADGFAGIIATFATGLSIGAFAEFIVILVRLCGKKLAARVREEINQNQEHSRVIDEYYEFAMNYHFRTGGERKGTLAIVK